jgi:hypothetical protein
VIFRVLAANSIGSADTMRVSFGSSVFDFGDADFDSGDDKTDPFGPSLEIPANTPITFTNSATYGTPPVVLSGSNPSSGNSWGLQGFTVEAVPEPSGIIVICLGALGLGAARLRKMA